MKRNNEKLTPAQEAILSDLYRMTRPLKTRRNIARHSDLAHFDRRSLNPLFIKGYAVWHDFGAIDDYSRDWIVRLTQCGLDRVSRVTNDRYIVAQA